MMTSLCVCSDGIGVLNDIDGIGVLNDDITVCVF